MDEIDFIQPKKVVGKLISVDVLDKIKAEINEVYNDRPHSYNHSQRIELFCKVMKIIDKYRAESEVSDADSN